jgi:hypothetical protein
MKFGQSLSAPSIRARLGLSRSNEDLTELCIRSAEVIDRMKSARVARFDPFVLCDTNPLERPLNRVLARLFEPHGIHGLGLVPIRGLLCAVKERAPEKAGPILHALKGSPHVRVEQDFFHSVWGMVDIALLGTGFLIFLENKRRGNGETNIPAGQQIERYRNFLDEEARQRGAQHTLGIFLSPDDKLPSDPSFVRLCSSDLADAMRREIDACEGVSDDNRLLVTAFLTSYKWFS